jgi:hypothetical protein
MYVGHGLFGSSDNTERIAKKFIDTLQSVVETFTDDEKRFLNTDFLKTAAHSYRKGTVSYLTSLIDGPSYIAIVLRTMWRLPSSQDTYVHLTKDSGSDQVV